MEKGKHTHGGAWEGRGIWEERGGRGRVRRTHHQILYGEWWVEKEAKSRWGYKQGPVSDPCLLDRPAMMK